MNECVFVLRSHENTDTFGDSGKKKKETAEMGKIFQILFSSFTQDQFFIKWGTWKSFSNQIVVVLFRDITIISFIINWKKRNLQRNSYK